jgi:hypothetical protein
MTQVRRALYILAFPLIACLFIIIPSLQAQQTLGSINGTVVDSTGAAIPGATVTVVNNGTDLTRSTKTRNDGTFQILNLSIGKYKVTVDHSGFKSASYPAITVRSALATTVPVTLQVGSSATTVQVNANPLLDNTDTTNGYTLDKAEIASAPLATGSFTQLAILAPGTSADFIAGVGTNQGLGNQNIWANGQRATDNSYSVNGVSVVNLFNGMSASQEASQRFNFNIGEGSTSVGGQSPNSTSVYGSNGNGLASPPPEFMSEVQVTTSMYGADQGGTSGAQVSVNTSTGSNQFHGQLYGHFGNNALNAVPYFYKQDIALGSLDSSYANPSLHKWIAGGTVGGPIIKNKLFFFLGYQHLYTSDQFGALSRIQVPYGLTNDRSLTGIQNALCSYFTATLNGSAKTAGLPGNSDCATNGTQGVPQTSWNSSAIKILQAKLPDGSYLIPSVTDATTAASNLMSGNPDVSQVGTALFRGDQATASLDYNATSNDHLTAKYYYQHTPATSPFSLSSVLGFPGHEDSGSQVASLNNSIDLGSNINWEQRIGFSRQKVYSTYSAPFSASSVGISVPGGDYFPGLSLNDFAQRNSNATGLSVGPASDFVNDGYFQNRYSASSNAIFSLGKHTVSVGFDFNYTQLNVRNNRIGHAQLSTSNFASFLQGSVRSGTVLEGYSNRHYRNNDAGAFLQDKWQVKPNIAVTAGLRYDFNGPFREANGLMFNFDPSLYKSSPAAITNSGFIVAGNNKQFGTPGVSDSTLKGRQWGIAPRVGIAWSPKRFHNTVVWRAGAGIYYNRGEYFQYLSPPAGNGISGPFGVTQEAPFAAFTNVNGNLSQPFTSITAPTTPANIASQLPTLDQEESECDGLDIYNGNNLSGFSCEAIPAIIGNYNIHNVLPYSENWTLDFQWQPKNNTLIDIAYVGNRGKHEIVPLPFNEPGIATPNNPINGQIYSYGVETISPNLDANGNPYIDKYEPYDTYSGGNVDLRVPYTGYDPNSTSFTSAAISSYDALQARIQRRMSHGLQFGLSYTWSHTLDEQSDIGLFFTGDNPQNLRSSYADADFDRTNVTTANFTYQLPSIIHGERNPLHFVTNGWALEGITVFQSGQPYSVYDYSGSVGNEYFGGNIFLLNPVLPLRPGVSPSQAETGYNGAMGQVTNPPQTALNPSDFQIPLLAPGQNGVPPCDTTSDGGNAGPGGGPLCDVYETTFVPGQRNIFRQSFQKRVDLTIQKTFEFRHRYGLNYQFEVFNLTNTPSFDVPSNNVQLSPTFLELNAYSPYANGTQVQPYASNTVEVPNGTNTGGTGTCQGSSQACAYELYTNPTSTNTTLGVVQNTIGSSRIVEMALHLTF